jgi:hypothetical protein
MCLLQGMFKNPTHAVMTDSTITRQPVTAMSLFHALICARTRAVRVGRERGSRRPRRPETRERDGCARGNPHHDSQTDACRFPSTCRLRSAASVRLRPPKVHTREPAAQASIPSLPEPKTPTRHARWEGAMARTAAERIEHKLAAGGRS